MKKTFKVVMLSTEKASDLFIGKTHNKLHYKNTTPDEDCKVYQHLYIISDDEIKEGDWLIGGANDESENEVWKHDGLGYISKEDKKIVATTDKSIKTFIPELRGELDEYTYLPQIPESFIQAYIKAYNEGKPITEVDLEIELEESEETKKWFEDKLGKSLPDLEYIIKTRPDNTVIVHQSKMYTRDEVKELIYKFSTKVFSEKFGIEDTNKWIQDNL